MEMSRRRRSRRNPEEIEDWSMYGALPSGGLTETEEKMLSISKKRRKGRKAKKVAPKKHRARKADKRKWSMKVWKSNPSAHDKAHFGILSDIKGVMMPPKLTGYTQEPMYAFGVGLLGIVDTGLIGMALDAGCSKFACQWKKDACRIVGKIGFGTLVSYAVSKGTHKPYLGQYHQMGVYFNTILDVVGTIAKHYLASKQPKSTPEVTQTGYYNSPMTAGTAAMNILGFGQINNALGQSKINKALATGGIVVAKGDNGQVALANTKGEILVSGPADAMQPVIQGVVGKTNVNPYVNKNYYDNPESFVDDPIYYSGTKGTHKQTVGAWPFSKTRYTWRLRDPNNNDIVKYTDNYWSKQDAVNDMGIQFKRNKATYRTQYGNKITAQVLQNNNVVYAEKWSTGSGFNGFQPSSWSAKQEKGNYGKTNVNPDLNANYFNNPQSFTDDPIYYSGVGKTNVNFDVNKDYYDNPRNHIWYFSGQRKR